MLVLSIDPGQTLGIALIELKQNPNEPTIYTAELKQAVVSSVPMSEHGYPCMRYIIHAIEVLNLDNVEAVIWEQQPRGFMNKFTPRHNYQIEMALNIIFGVRNFLTKCKTITINAAKAKSILGQKGKVKKQDVVTWAKKSIQNFDTAELFNFIDKNKDQNRRHDIADCCLFAITALQSDFLVASPFQKPGYVGNVFNRFKTFFETSSASVLGKRKSNEVYNTETINASE